MTSRLWLVTNKVTHARAVIVADSADAARTLRPDSDLKSVVWRHGRWIQLAGTASGDGPAPPLACWPDELELVHATELGRAGRLFSGTRQVIAFERDPQLRQAGEGPDDTWGCAQLRIGDSAKLA